MRSILVAMALLVAGIGAQPFVTDRDVGAVLLWFAALFAALLIVTSPQVRGRYPRWHLRLERLPREGTVDIQVFTGSPLDPAPHFTTTREVIDALGGTDGIARLRGVPGQGGSGGFAGGDHAAAGGGGGGGGPGQPGGRGGDATSGSGTAPMPWNRLADELHRQRELLREHYSEVERVIGPAPAPRDEPDRPVLPLEWSARAWALWNAIHSERSKGRVPANYEDSIEWLRTMRDGLREFGAWTEELDRVSRMERWTHVDADLAMSAILDISGPPVLPDAEPSAYRARARRLDQLIEEADDLKEALTHDRRDDLGIEGFRVAAETFLASDFPDYPTQFKTAREPERALLPGYHQDEVWIPLKRVTAQLEVLREIRRELRQRLA